MTCCVVQRRGWLYRLTVKGKNAASDGGLAESVQPRVTGGGHETLGCDLGGVGLSDSGLLGSLHVCDTTGIPRDEPETTCGSGCPLSHLSDFLCCAPLPLPYFVEAVSSDQRCDVRGGRPDA